MGERRPATANGGAYRLVRRLWLLVGERGRRAPAAGVGINRVSTPFEQNGTSTCTGTSHRFQDSLLRTNFHPSRLLQG